MTASKPLRKTQVLSLGLPRTGTSSMCEALTLLSYKDVYHGIKSIDSPTDWAVFSRAADATFPNLPTYTGKPFTTEEWDEVFGECEAVTDIGSIFGPQLIEAYPDAKVVLVQRDYERWYKSMDEQVFHALWGRLADFFIETVEPIIGSVTGPANRKMILGLFRASTVDEARDHARETYERHYKTIREMTPPERLLEFDPKDGWRPLCEFLGKDIPKEWVGREGEFPHVNEAAAMRKKIMEQQFKLLKKAANVVVRYAALPAAAVAVWYTRGRLW
ncbi:P-loop containing nucleoside triphosphate hydrolase protein [Microdochium trichocladiopsis]|uniref:P-loop containing nucleoside triphosphate hydrolase protein n=1 Tax=Microdochium trichocladiopsis TaxID=1682393 RepID=A0A9P8YIL9_9PEZI|nr:P-loop containing nucleoside triphosphate hydrolase protein [Microdochium trichocladiopsis]KAH7040006.1 P-loop containing nucleoside triphosphate hydrolase protein [Microdochium trichocladiopsis]